MSESTSSMFKGIGTGVLTGVIVGMASSLLVSGNKKSKRKISKMIDSFENKLESVQDMFK